MEVYPNSWKILLCVIIIAVSGTAEIERLYPPGDLTDRSHACVGNEEIILSCRGRGQNITWTATLDSVDIGRIVFFNSDTEGRLISQGIIRGFLIDVDGNNNLVSELRVTPTLSMRPISITCSSQTGRSSHLIAPPAVPDQPMLMTPRQLQQVDSDTTTILYYLQWEAPSNIENIDLDHYQLYSNDALVQRVHADQRYALINLQEGVPTTIKVAAANKCGQISNFSTETITPATTNRPQTTVVPTTDDDATAGPDIQTDTIIDDSTSGSQQSMVSLVLIAYTTLLAIAF